ncbi:hypothetical protein [Microseira wollei]|uniref:hypothetical protein n=1 Tax=Microseira wollei TaxID=467598 RepID=UPI001CFEA48A|nr:hypothetical protein [Microseira wollei]
MTTPRTREDLRGGCMVGKHPVMVHRTAVCRHHARVPLHKPSAKTLSNTSLAIRYQQQMRESATIETGLTHDDPRNRVST